MNRYTPPEKNKPAQLSYDQLVFHNVQMWEHIEWCNNEDRKLRVLIEGLMMMLDDICDKFEYQQPLIDNMIEEAKK